MHEIELPKQVTELMQRLIDHKYEAYAVGGAIRELYIGKRRPDDYDIITNADLDRIRAIFDDCRLNEEYLRNGTLLINAKGLVVAIAPYRKGFIEDGIPIYSEKRIDDLLRRDFTINTICADIDSNIIDIFGGVDCLETEPYTLKAVGEGFSADGEASVSSIVSDPSNLMNALLKASAGEYEYHIESGTEKTIKENASTILTLSNRAQRVFFEAVLLGKRAADVLLNFKEVVFEIYPELRATDEYVVNGQTYEYTLYEHICKSIGYSKPDFAVRYALLFHDAGMLDCEAKHGEEITYFGHTERACIYAKRAMMRVNVSPEIISETIFLIENNEICNETGEFDPKEYLDVLTPNQISKIMLFASANLRAKNTKYEHLAYLIRKQSDEILNL